LDIEERKDIVLKNIENGYYLKGLRYEKGLRLIDVANKIGVNSTYLSDIENGKKTINEDIIGKLSLIYGVDEIELSIRFGMVSWSVIEGLKKDEELHRRVWEMVKKNMDGNNYL